MTGGVGLTGVLGKVAMVSTGIVSGTIGNMLNQGITKGFDNINYKEAGIQGLTVGVGAGTFGIGGKVTQEGIKAVGQYAIKGAVTGAATDATYQYLTKGKVDLKEIGMSALGGAVVAPLAVKATTTAIDKFGTQLKNPLENIKYSKKVTEQMKLNDYHSFPESVDGFGRYGKTTLIKGGDGIIRTKVNISGGYKGKTGVFEYIIEPDNSVKHRFFKPNK